MTDRTLLAFVRAAGLGIVLAALLVALLAGCASASVPACTASPEVCGRLAYIRHQIEHPTR